MNSVVKSQSRLALQALRESCPNDPRLAPETVYTLPPCLARLLAEERFGILSLEDVKFEDQLRRACGSGFHRDEPFASIVLDKPENEASGFPHEIWLVDHPNCTEEFHYLWDESNTSERFGENSDQVIAVRETARSLAQDLRFLLRGYVAWLMHNAKYRSELQTLRENWDHERIPAMPHCKAEVVDPKRLRVHSHPEAVWMQHRINDATRFLNRWSLIQLQTWELPLPVAANTLMTGSPMQESLGATSDCQRSAEPAGMSLFLPWWLLADRDFSINRMRDYHVARLDLSRYDSWSAPKGKGRLGRDRYENLLDIHLYLNLALKARYPEKVRGRSGVLDTVFGEWIRTRKRKWTKETAVDSVKKIRLEGERLMRQKISDPGDRSP
jgi:hypothetical protein